MWVYWGGWGGGVGVVGVSWRQASARWVHWTSKVEEQTSVECLFTFTFNVGQLFFFFLLFNTLSNTSFWYNRLIHISRFFHCVFCTTMTEGNTGCYVDILVLPPSWTPRPIFSFAGRPVAGSIIASSLSCCSPLSCMFSRQKCCREWIWHIALSVCLAVSTCLMSRGKHCAGGRRLITPKEKES